MQCRLKKHLTWPLLAIVLLLPESIHAIPITFTVNSLGGNLYRYTYGVSNDGSLGVGVPVELFDILFPTNLYADSSLAIVTPSTITTDWSQLILASAPGVPAAYDVLALSGGISLGGSVAGFAVEFLWLGGASAPGAQAFEVFNPNTFALLQSGMTAPAQPPIPEPGMLVLFSTGLFSLAWWRRGVRRLQE